MTHMQPFFGALLDIIRADEPAPKRNCRWCRDGEREDGSSCPWCGPETGDALVDDMSVEQACKNMGIKP